MKIAVISLTENGRKISKKIAANLQEDHSLMRYTFEKYTDEDSIRFHDLKKVTSDIFHKYDAVIFISACGIAVRMIAMHIISKETDPAVVVIDEQGKFVISLLSGHLGGANELTEKIADIINALPVITTATDIGKKFSPDSFAKANNLYIGEMNIAKEIAALIINNEKIGFHCDYPLKNYTDNFFDENEKNIGICICDNMSETPFIKTLHLIPKNIVIGVGCKKNTDPQKFCKFINHMLEKHNIPIYRVCELHTIDIKANENAVKKYSEKNKIPLKFYSPEKLMSISGEFTASDFVLNITGADNICERSAAINEGTLIVKKQAENGMTFAAAEEKIIIDFERTII